MNNFFANTRLIIIKISIVNKKNNKGDSLEKKKSVNFLLSKICEGFKPTYNAAPIDLKFPRGSSVIDCANAKCFPGSAISIEIAV